MYKRQDVGLGYTSIFNTGGNVGVSTGDPRNSFQVGGNVRTGQIGVGIKSDGHIKASGIVTATGLDINGDIDVDGHTNLDNVSVAGVSTFTGTIDANGNLDVAGTLDVDGHAEFDNVNIAGVSTVATLNATNVNIAGLSTHRVAFTNASDNLTDSDDFTFNDTANVLNIVGTTDTDQLKVSGVSTLTGNVSVGATLTGHIKIPDNKTLKIGAGLTATYIPGAYAEVAVHQESNVHHIIENSNKKSAWISRVSGVLVPQFRIWNNAAVEAYYANGSMTVSYTHLTLPTIYSV